MGDGGEFFASLRLTLLSEKRCRADCFALAAGCASEVGSLASGWPSWDFLSFPLSRSAGDLRAAGMPLDNMTSRPGCIGASKYMARRKALFTVICVLTIVLFWGPLITLFSLSLRQEISSYPFLVLPASIGLIYVKRKTIFFDVRYCLGPGIALVFAGVMLYWLDEKHLQNLSPTDSLSLAVFSTVVVLVGGFVLCYGSKAFRVALFPLSFLLLMVPIPAFLLERLVLSLQRGSAEATCVLFRLTGVPVVRQGFTFSLADVTIEIAQQCSGIRSSLALFIMSLLAGYVFLRSNWKRAFFSVFVILVAIVKNGVRIVTLSLLGVYVDGGFLTGELHHRYGGIVFSALALAVLVPVLRLLQDKKEESKAAHQKHSGRRVVSCPDPL